MICIHEGLRTVRARMRPWLLLVMRLEGFGWRPGPPPDWEQARADLRWYLRDRCGHCRGRGLVPSYFHRDHDVWTISLCPQCGQPEPLCELER